MCLWINLVAETVESNIALDTWNWVPSLYSTSSVASSRRMSIVFSLCDSVSCLLSRRHGDPIELSADVVWCHSFSVHATSITHVLFLNNIAKVYASLLFLVHAFFILPLGQSNNQKSTSLITGTTLPVPRCAMSDCRTRRHALMEFDPTPMTGLDLIIRHHVLHWAPRVTRF